MVICEELTFLQRDKEINKKKNLRGSQLFVQGSWGQYDEVSLWDTISQLSLKVFVEMVYFFKLLSGTVLFCLKKLGAGL